MHTSVDDYCLSCDTDGYQDLLHLKTSNRSCLVTDGASGDSGVTSRPTKLTGLTNWFSALRFFFSQPHCDCRYLQSKLP